MTQEGILVWKFEIIHFFPYFHSLDLQNHALKQIYPNSNHFRIYSALGRGVDSSWVILELSPTLNAFFWKLLFLSWFSTASFKIWKEASLYISLSNLPRILVNSNLKYFRKIRRGKKTGWKFIFSIWRHFLFLSFFLWKPITQ